MVVLCQLVPVSVQVDLFNQFSVQAVNNAQVCEVDEATGKADITIKTHLHLCATTGSSFNPLECKSNYNATSYNMNFVHWPMMGGLFHLVQRGLGGASAHPGPSSLYET